MGELCANGEGVPQDDAAAATWYRKAAEQGDGNARSNLGVLYQAGRGVPQDYVQTYV
ncbi:MAG: sel1 repeat family protein [Candidatus Rokubacteria bacterium]|nr:sel1 repeat family protein [Candidatus Rokubacteria bacterium]